MPRPVGITILGVLVLIAAVILVLIGIASFFVGLAFLLPQTGISGAELILSGLLYFVIGVVLGVAGSGLMRLRPWAWGLALLATLVGLVYLAYGIYQQTQAAAPVGVWSFVTLAIVGLIFVYLIGVRSAFRAPARAP